MAVLDDIFKRLLPDDLTHPGLELADRRQSQHFLILAVALSIPVIQGQAGQAGIGEVQQVQVSNHSLVGAR